MRAGGAKAAEIVEGLFEQQFFLAHLALAHGKQFAVVGFQGEKTADFVAKGMRGGFGGILGLPLFDGVGERQLQGGFGFLNPGQL